MTNRLSCNIVRDLLPYYVDELTEEETNQAVEEHLSTCSKCKEKEQKLRQNKTPFQGTIHTKKELNFLKRYSKLRLLAACLIVIVTAAFMVLAYNSEFRYENTEAGRQDAVNAFESMSGADAAGWAVDQEYLYIFYVKNQYAVDRMGAEQVYGGTVLKKGINGKYRIMSQDTHPSMYTAGLYFDRIRRDDTYYYYFATYNVRDIYQAEVTFQIYGTDQDKEVIKTYSFDGKEYLTLTSSQELLEEWGVSTEIKDYYGIYLTEMKLYDKAGNDVTELYLVSSNGNTSWGSGTGIAEPWLVYAVMGIVFALGLILLCFVLVERNDKPVKSWYNKG